MIKNLIVISINTQTTVNNANNGNQKWITIKENLISIRKRLLNHYKNNKVNKEKEAKKSQKIKKTKL